MYIVFGTLAATWPIAEFSTLISTHGLRFELRDSSHYQGGQYLRLLDSRTHLTVERTSQNECLIRADAESLDEVAPLLRRFSGALSALRVAHRLELYGDDDKLVDSFAGEA